MANSDKNIRITTSKNKATFPNIVFTGSAAGSSVITLEILDDNTMSFTSNEGQVFSLDSNLTVGTIWSVNDVSGIPLLRASAGGTIGIGEFGQSVGIGTQTPSLSHKLTVTGGAAFGTSVDTGMQFVLNTNAVKGSNSFEARFGNEIRSYRLDDTNYVGFKASASNVQSRTYTLPTNFPGTGASYLQSDTSGNLIWVAPATGGGGSGTVTSITTGTGLTTAVLGPITTTGHIRALRPLVVSFCSGYTPVTSGADAVVVRIPDSPEDGVISLTYRPEEFHVRVETPSAGTSTIQLDKSSGTGAFSAIAVTSINIAGAGIYETSTISFSTAGTFLTSGDKLRLNFTTLNATHANFSIYLELQEV
jgi:hypothetical protein